MRLTLLFPLLLLALPGKAQRRHVVWDKANNIPVAHASLHTTRGGRVLATSTDSSGTARVDFPFSRITVSHISYEPQTLAALPDTVFLQPTTELLPEVTIRQEEPRWIREKLRRFVKNRNRLYLTHDTLLAYRYHTRNLSDSVGYAFDSEGQLYTPSLAHMDKDSMYLIHPERNVVHYRDTTARADFSCMKLMLYEHLVAEFDNKFIRRHHFGVNTDYRGAPNVVQLVFWADKHRDDRGTLTLDTARCVVLEASRSTGLQTNLDEKIGSFLLGVFKHAVGLRYDDWTIDHTISFRDIGGTLYPEAITYKYYERYSSYDKFAVQANKTRLTKFSTREATLTLSPADGSPLDHPVYDLPHEIHAAIVYIESKRHARNRLAMRQMARSYVPFE